jgi:tetratricopeptide (TPR) repeat protein
LDEALAHYDRVLALKPDLAGAWYARGNVFYKLKRHDEALAAYNKATAINSDLADAWLGCGNALSELKRYDDALMAYGKTLMLKPDFAEAWLGQGNVFSELRSYDKAFVNYDEALVIQPSLAGAWLGRGNVLYHLKRYDEALAPLAPLVRPLARELRSLTAWHIYAVRIDFAGAKLERSRLMRAMATEGIGTQVHYIPVHRQPYYRNLYGDLALPGADGGRVAAGQRWLGGGDGQQGLGAHGQDGVAVEGVP